MSAQPERDLEQVSAAVAMPGGGADPGLVRAWCEVQTRLADAERAAGDLSEAHTRLCAVLARAGAALGDGDDGVLDALVALGMVHRDAGRTDYAAVAYRRVLSLTATESPLEERDLDRLEAALLAAALPAAARAALARRHRSASTCGWAAASENDHVTGAQGS